ncbi:MAG: heat-inducible transcriptional repressor HrcA [Clostridia bacterium]
MKLSERKHKLLVNAIEEHIKDASPITSGSVAEKQNLNLSTATLRSELSALEEMGYLKQMHTSGGRLPTAMGYKYYVNSLLNNLKASPKQLKIIHEQLLERADSLLDIVSKIAKTVAEQTSYPTVVLLDGAGKLVIEQIQIVSLVANQALILIKTQSGCVYNTISTNATESSCKDVSNFLTQQFKSKTLEFLLENINQFTEAYQKMFYDFKNMINNIIDIIRKLLKFPPMQIKGHGAQKMLSQSAMEQTQKIFGLLENESTLAKAVKSDNDNLTLLMEDDGEMQGCAIIKAPIRMGGQQIASIGVVGPERMDYASIASTLKLVTDELSGQTKNKKKEKK